MTNTTPLAYRQHDHGRCIATALSTAKQRCQKNGVRLTALREQVLTLIWNSHIPLGAYTLIDMLAAESTRRVAPPTVYRALDFLLEQHLIHRIHSLNAFIGCSHPDGGHPNNFLICKQCGIAVEFDNKTFTPAIAATVRDTGFEVQSQTIELVGLCEQCQGVKHE